MRLNLKKLASVTAAGAGALALTSSKAEAETIIYSNILNQTAGFGPGVTDAAFKTFTDIGGPSFLFLAIQTHSRLENHYSRTLQANAGSVVAFGFALTNANHIHFQTFSAGAVWSNDFVGGGGTRTFANRAWGSGSTHVFGSAFTDKYLLFQFETNSLLQYGWAEASLQLTEADSNAGADGPNLTIISYAYDSSGALLPAGDKGVLGALPEPSSLAESGIAALLLGAEGLRRWRKARRGRGKTAGVEPS